MYVLPLVPFCSRPHLFRNCFAFWIEFTYNCSLINYTLYPHTTPFVHVFLIVFFSCFSFPISDWLSCRQVLNIMVILGFMLNYALRVNLTMAIVEMVEDPKHEKHSIAAAALTTANETQHDTHNGLSSASHTLLLPSEIEAFHNATENVSVAQIVCNDIVHVFECWALGHLYALYIHTCRFLCGEVVIWILLFLRLFRWSRVSLGDRHSVSACCSFLLFFFFIFHLSEFRLICSSCCFGGEGGG